MARPPRFLSADDAYWFYARPGDEPEDHWGWTGRLDKQGYGTFDAEGEKFCAHRYACTLLNGPRPDGKHALHKCGPSRWCVNPNHLAWGTHAENMADRDEDGTTFRGKSRANAKLTDDIVLAIYTSTDSDVNVARVYGVSPGVVTNIRLGRTWVHLTKSMGEPARKRRRSPTRSAGMLRSRA